MNGIDNGHGVKVQPSRYVLNDKNGTTFALTFLIFVNDSVFENIHGNV